MLRDKHVCQPPSFQPAPRCHRSPRSRRWRTRRRPDSPDASQGLQVASWRGLRLDHADGRCGHCSASHSPCAMARRACVPWTRSPLRGTARGLHRVGSSPIRLGA
jgi:hypothetical protein